MIKAGRVGRWIFLIPLLGSVFASCDETGPPGDYTSIKGVYTCYESSAHSGARQYPVEIDRVKNSEDNYIILNFHNKGQNEFLFAEQSADSLLVLNQTIVNIIVNGQGLIREDNKSIQLNYLTDDGTTILDYYCTYSR